ncbi:MAG: class I mannose-6-phosphate isomerase [Ruminococcaceae bacterium]|nr:class I mannose-6-phosphate isomerase [Oscillospiraceae bacterium]
MKPQKLYPAFKNYIWGGERLKEEYRKVTDLSPCAESWELSFHKDGECRLSDGRKLSEAVGEKELGVNPSKFPDFPLLIKYIDAKSDLSIQVHPTDAYAASHEGGFGKTEMWYVVDADEGAGIYLGFKREISKEEFRAAIEQNTLCELLNFIEVRSGDCFFIPAGTIHAIGKGCLIYEIQQNSNLTYRVFDYGRRDAQGKLRELHVEKALDVTETKKYSPTDFGEYLGISEYFKVKKLKVSGKVTMATDRSSFHCLSCLEGGGRLEGEPIGKGDSFFIPADYGEYLLEGDMTLIFTEV